MKGEKEQMDQLQGHQTKYITWIQALPEYNQSEQVCTAELRSKLISITLERRRAQTILKNLGVRLQTL